MFFLSVENDGRAAPRLNESNKNFHILMELLQTRSDLVIQYFELEHFTFEDFKVSIVFVLIFNLL